MMQMEFQLIWNNVSYKQTVAQYYIFCRLKYWKKKSTIFKSNIILCGFLVGKGFF